MSELEVVGGIRGDLPAGDGVADLAGAAEAIPAQLEAGYTTICFKPSQFTDTGRGRRAVPRLVASARG